MYCIHCGNVVKPNESYCAACGKEITGSGVSTRFANRSLIHWKTVIITTLVTSVLWFVYYFGYIDTSHESVNIIGHLLETVGRQKQAWTKSEQITELIAAAFSEECMYTEGCLDEVRDSITALRTEIDREGTEIDNLWSEGVFGNDFESYFSTLDEDSQEGLLDVVNLYFPDETEELETTNKLL